MNRKIVDDRLQEIATFVHARLHEVADRRGGQVLDPEYRWQHTLRVSNCGRIVAEAEGADVELVVAACLLHDVAHFDQDDWTEHGRLGARIIRPLLAKLGYSSTETANVCFSVAVHVDGRADFEHPETLESRVVSDADNIDRFGAYRIVQWCTADVQDYDDLIAKLKQRLTVLEEYRQRRVMETETGHKLFNRQLDLQIAVFKALVAEGDLTSLPTGSGDVRMRGRRMRDKDPRCTHTGEKGARGRCPFCPPAVDAAHVIQENRHCLYLEHEEPVLVGSGLIVPKRHRQTVFDLTEEEWLATFDLLQRAKEWIDQRLAPDGYNLGWNCGPVAGQEVVHVHLHVIPRFRDEPLAGRGIRHWLKQPSNKRSGPVECTRGGITPRGEEKPS